jgi:hypothetical protein
MARCVRAGDAVTLVQSVVRPGAAGLADPRAQRGAANGCQERAAGKRPSIAEGWGISRARIARWRLPSRTSRDSRANTRSISPATGKLAFRFAPVGSGGTHSFAVYQHYVSVPVSVGAATSPIAMATPLEFHIR